VDLDPAAGWIRGRAPLKILCEQRRHGPDRPPLAINFSDHVRERDVIPHDLGAYDD
jgi:hypothetical protein